MGAPLEQGDTLDVAMDPELVLDSEEQDVELEEPSGLDTGVCVSVAVVVIEYWLETDPVLLGTPEGVLTVTIVEVAVKLPVPDGITGWEDEGLTVPDGVPLGSLTDKDVL